jgi:hypothetical protein
VVGASQHGIVILLTSYFLKLVLIATLVALPIGFILAQDWLSNFVYAIDIELWMFVITAGAAIILMMITIGGFVFQASRINPAITLKANN